MSLAPVPLAFGETAAPARIPAVLPQGMVVRHRLYVPAAWVPFQGQDKCPGKGLR